MKLRDLAVSESGFIFDPSGGGVYTVNGVGKLILRLLAEGADKNEVEALIRSGYDTGEADVGRDIAEFMVMLKEQRLLEPEE